MPIHPYRLCVHSHKQLNRLILQNSQTRFVRAILEIYIILSRQRYVQHNTHTSSERYRHSRIWCINVIKLYKAMDFVWFAPVDQTAIFERRRRLRRWRHWNSISSARLAAAAKFIHNRFPDLLSSFDCENCVYFFFAALLAVGCAFLCGHICIECNVHSSQRWNMPGYLWFWCSVCVCVRLSIAECSCSRKIENDNWIYRARKIRNLLGDYVTNNFYGRQTNFTILMNEWMNIATFIGAENMIYDFNAWLNGVIDEPPDLFEPRLEGLRKKTLHTKSPNSINWVSKLKIKNLV